MVVRIFDSLGRSLQGRILGRQHFAHVCEMMASIPTGELIFFDFDGIRQLTASWVSAMFVPFFRWSAEAQNDLFPLICNLESDFLDEFQLVGEWNKHPYLKLLDGTSPPHRAVLIGTLDPAQQTTLDAVLQLSEVTGAELARRRSDQGIAATAWNNRLRDLHTNRLVRRRKEGRETVYVPVATEVLCDGRQLPTPAGP